MAELELTQEFFKEQIDLTKGKRVDVTAIAATLKANRDREFKTACVKLLIEGVKLSDSRKVGNRTLKDILSENDVQFGESNKFAPEDVLTISRITRVLAPILVGMDAPEKKMTKAPMEDLNPQAKKYWCVVSAMWCEEMWLDDAWRAAYLATMLALDHIIITKGGVKEGGITVVNRALRIFGKAVLVDIKKEGGKPKTKEEYVNDGADAMKGWDFKSMKANVVFASRKQAAECLFVAPIKGESSGSGSGKKNK